MGILFVRLVVRKFLRLFKDLASILIFNQLPSKFATAVTNCIDSQTHWRFFQIKNKNFLEISVFSLNLGIVYSKGKLFDNANTVSG